MASSRPVIPRALLALGASLPLLCAPLPAAAQQAAPADPPRAAVPPQAATPARQSEPDAVVRALYAHYLDDTSVDGFDFTSPGEAKTYFEPGLAKLMVADGQREEPRLDFDPFVDGQDFELHDLAYETAPVSDAEALVTARFTNFDEKKTVVFKVVRTPQGWRIFDATSGDPSRSLRALLSDPPR